MLKSLLRSRISGGLLLGAKKLPSLQNASVRFSPAVFSCRQFHFQKKYDVLCPFQHKGIHTSRASFGVVGFKLADIGEGIAEVELIKWYKNVGDPIEEMENVCTVQSDKAAVEITSRYTGTVKKLHYNKGNIIKIGSTLMDIEADGEGETETSSENETKQKGKEEEKPSTKSTSSSSGGGGGGGFQNKGEILTSPACRRLAKELNVDLRNVKGTGKDGRISKEDIENYVKESKEAAGGSSSASSTPPPQSSYSPPPPPSPSSSPSPPASISIPPYVPFENTEVQLKGFSRAMVKMMNESLKIPHLNIGDEYDITDLVEARLKLKEAVMKDYGMSFTFTPLIIKAVSLSLNKIPILNSKIDPSGAKYTLYGSHNISIAVDTANGLVVPNIKNVQNLSILQIQAELLRLQKLANSNSLSQNDLSGGTVSISNVGVIAGTYVKPILFDGQAMIMGIGRVQKVPRFDSEGKVCGRYIINCAYSADHRHCDGATVARFTAEMKKYLENPALMLLHMH